MFSSSVWKQIQRTVETLACFCQSETDMRADEPMSTRAEGAHHPRALDSTRIVALKP